MIKVESTMIKEADWDPKTCELSIKFVRGKEIYIYENISVEVWESFLASESKGQFFSQTIRGRPEQYPYRRVGDHDDESR